MFLHGDQKAKTSSQILPRGVITFSGWRYDLLVRWFVMRGNERTFRRMVADRVHIQPGEAVLDVGCGTGTQALLAKVSVGETGCVCGIDPSASLLATARRKARRAGLSIDFLSGGIEHIPVPAQSFNVVLSTFMMHHVPDQLKARGLAEIARVLAPGGRLLIVDFKHTAREHEQTGTEVIDIQEMPRLLREAGFFQIETGEIPFHLRSVSATHQHYSFVYAKKA